MADQPFVTEKALYLTEDRERVVEAGDPEARYLIAFAGDVVDAGVVEQYGLAKQKAKPADKQRAPAKNKAKGAS